MKTFKKCTAILLVLPIIWLFMPQAAFCADPDSTTKSHTKKITQHKPRVKSSPEKDIALMKASKGDKKKPKWLWIGLGAAVVVGLAVAALGAGGGDNGSDPDPPEGEGTITVGW